MGGVWVQHYQSNSIIIIWNVAGTFSEDLYRCEAVPLLCLDAVSGEVIDVEIGEVRCGSGSTEGRS